MKLQDIQMSPLEGGILRRLLVPKHTLIINQAERSISLLVAVLHFRRTTDYLEDVQINVDNPCDYIGKGDGKKWYKLEFSDRKLVDSRTGLYAERTEENAVFLMAEFTYLEQALESGTGIFELVQTICQSNVDRASFENSIYEVR